MIEFLAQVLYYGLLIFGIIAIVVTVLDGRKL